MTKQAISPDQFLEEMNRQLHQMSQYKSGMSVVSVPSGTAGWEMSGYDLACPNNEIEFTVKAALLSKAFHAVDSKFVIHH